MRLPETAASALADVLSLFEDADRPAMIVGGVATFAWGDPRTTRDLDVAVLAEESDLDEVRAILEDGGLPVDGPFSTAFGPRFVLPLDRGLPVDVFLDDRRDLFERRRQVNTEGEQLWVASPEDVVIEKLTNADRFPEDRDQDLRDAASILYKQAENLDRDYLGKRARDQRVEEVLEAVLEEVRSADER